VERLDELGSIARHKRHSPSPDEADQAGKILVAAFAEDHRWPQNARAASERQLFVRDRQTSMRGSSAGGDLMRRHDYPTWSVDPLEHPIDSGVGQLPYNNHLIEAVVRQDLIERGTVCDGDIAHTVPAGCRSHFEAPIAKRRSKLGSDESGTNNQGGHLAAIR
jgi:hypothetical protein